MINIFYYNIFSFKKSITNLISNYIKKNRVAFLFYSFR